MGYGDSFEQKSMTLDFASQMGLLKDDSVPHPQTGRLVRTIRLNRSHELVVAILAAEFKDTKAD